MILYIAPLYVKFALVAVLISSGHLDGNFLAVDPAFLTMFTLPLAAGDAATALDDPQSLVLAHETAQNRRDAPPAFQPVPRRSNRGEPNRHRRWYGPRRSRAADV